MTITIQRLHFFFPFSPILSRPRIWHSTHCREEHFFTCSKSDYCVVLCDTRFWHEPKKNNACKLNSEVERHDVVCCMLWADICVCVGAASHRPRMLVGPVWCQRSVLSGRHSGLSAWRWCAWVDCCLYSTSLSHMCLLPTDLWRTHTNIHFRKHGFESKHINGLILL